MVLLETILLKSSLVRDSSSNLDFNCSNEAISSLAVFIVSCLCASASSSACFKWLYIAIPRVNTAKKLPKANFALILMPLSIPYYQL